MSIFQILYLYFLTLSLAICLYAYPSFERNKSLKVFAVLLSFSVITELIVNAMRYVFGYGISDYMFIYHLYIPLEYALLAYFFYLNNDNQTVKKFILLSIPLFMVLSILLSLNIISPKEHPGLNLNLEGLLLITWCLIKLFSIRPSATTPNYRLPIFWICIGILIYHTGTYYYNHIYDNLLNINSELAQSLHRLTHKSLNYVLYICFSIAFLCSNQMKKYLLPS